MTAREQGAEVDVAGLREVAEAANDAPMSSTERLLAWDTYVGATYPDVILALLDRLERTEAAVARVRKVHAEYFDLDREPFDDASPEPEDVWRFDRDLRAALTGATP